MKSLILQIEEGGFNEFSLYYLYTGILSPSRTRKELEKELSNPKGKLLSSENQVDELLWKLDLLIVALNALSDTQENNEDLTETAKKNRRKSSQC